MINIDSLILRKFLEENTDFFLNAKVQKIRQPTRKELVLHMRNNCESRKLYININPQFYHLAFMSKENELKRDLKIPKQPPMFCMLLRKHMEGAKITKVQKPENERIIELYFENYNEIGDKIEECLSIELMGKHSNVVLYNTDTNIIIGCAHNIGAEKSKERELAGGLPYIYPPKQNKRDLLKTRSSSFFKILNKSDDNVKKTVNENFFEFSQFFVEAVCELNSINPDKIASELKEEEQQKLFISLVNSLNEDSSCYSVSTDYEKFSSIKKYPIKYESINHLIDDYFSFHIQKINLKTVRLNLSNIANKELKKLRNSLKNQIQLLENKSKSEKYKTKADLIMANLYTPEFIDVEIDESISLIENANNCYKKYSKAKKAHAVALEFSEKTKKDIKYYEDILFSIEVSETLQELKEIEEELMPSFNNEKKKKKEETSPVKKIEVNGFSVYIGKNNKQNDFIFSKISSPNDLWFHALNIPGAHILIKVPNESKTPDDKTLLKAAELTKEYSSAKNSGKVSVIYTQRKYVKKPPNQKGGMVTYKNEKEIVVE